MSWPRRVLSVRHDPFAPVTYSAEFETFWTRYPRRQNKARAWDAWQSERPTLAQVLDALTWQVTQPGWRQGYVPSAVNWITDHRWEDEPFHTADPPVSDGLARKLRAIVGPDDGG